MRCKKILVTGAGGLLGCRLVERLVLGEHLPVRAMGHRPAGALRLARLPVETVWCDITRADSVTAAVDGCDVIVHCAYGTGADAREARRVTVEGTRALVNAAVSAGVEQFIHISTIAVYSYSPPAVVSEASPLVRSGDRYCDSKIEAEEAVWTLTKNRALAATVLRMGNIYGPFSAPWTVRPLRHIEAGVASVVDGGEHASNAVFVDNAVEAILLSLKHAKAAGEAFFVTDDDLPWKVLYGAYAQWLGGMSLRSLDSEHVHALVRPSLCKRVGSVARDLWSNVVVPTARFGTFQVAESKSFGPLASGFWRHVSPRLREKTLGMRQGGFNDFLATVNPAGAAKNSLPAPGLLEVYAGKTVFSNEKAKALLGYGPRVDRAKALDLTAQWARWARLIPRS